MKLAFSATCNEYSHIHDFTWVGLMPTSREHLIHAQCSGCAHDYENYLRLQISQPKPFVGKHCQTWC